MGVINANEIPEDYQQKIPDAIPTIRVRKCIDGTNKGYRFRYRKSGVSRNTPDLTIEQLKLFDKVSLIGASSVTDTDMMEVVNKFNSWGVTVLNYMVL